MNKSETTKELALALSKAQAEMPPAELNKVNPFLKNKYADLGSIIKAAKPVLAKHGLALSQMPTGDGDKIGLTTILMHSSGEWLESTMMLTLEDSKGVTSAQAAGAIISYLRRYSIAAVLGMYADEDVDGNGAKSKAKPKPKSKPTSGGKMSLESAQEVKNNKGQKYGDLDTETLANMANALTKALKEEKDEVEGNTMTYDEVIEREYKLDAIKVILANR